MCVLIVTIEPPDDVVHVCIGSNLEITCTTEVTALLIWRFNNDDSDVVQYNSGDLGDEPDMVGLFETRVICFINTGMVLTSTAVLNNVTKLIDGVQLECGDLVFAAGSVQIKELSFSVRGMNVKFELILLNCLLSDLFNNSVTSFPFCS